MKIVLILLFIIAFFACKTQRGALYGKCGNHYYACTQVLLKSDGKFEYFQFYDVGGSTIIKGQWQSVNDTVILNTYEEQESILDTVIELSTANNRSKIEFTNGFRGYIVIDSSRFNLASGQNVLECDVSLKNIAFYFYDDQGNVIPVQYKVKNPLTNHLLVKVRRLTGDLILKAKKFIRTNHELKSVDQSWIGKRTSLKHKQW